MCANHYITTEIELKEHGESDRTVNYVTPDFSEHDGLAAEETTEVLCFKFGSAENATSFRKKFLECQQELRGEGTATQDESAKVDSADRAGGGGKSEESAKNEEESASSK